ncbi:hypothetical protein M2347_003146 [Chryseobacterium sp. H1D6B]|uniref:isochorismatase family protein n=1 Tax=Chryseobacterium sp. H1D6B TaxID=2940588 RepID=UPI0015CAED91|nr:isochorismatase family protein [Chryseobacterium sp. H1D6B]MDH6253419.1 hypothetical protein [Chryseobacterium sp. H1D6B]
MPDQTMNSYLKEIANVCGINKELTFHIARHIFATTVTLSNGVPIESVSKMLGHTNIKTTQHYAKILDKKVSDDIAILRSKMQNDDAGLWTEVCLQMPVLSALADGFEVYFITDASEGASVEAHQMAVQRMIQAGAFPITTWSYVSELNRD